MKFDYDLVIIGNTKEAIYAASKAVHLKARVALVLGTENANLSPSETIFEQECVPKIEENLYYNLSCLGVDIIIGNGEFVSRTEQVFLVNNRKVNSRSYLIATGGKIQLPNIPELDQIGCLTLDDLLASCYDFQLITSRGRKSLPENLAIIGNNPQAIELSQKLAREGKQVNLIFPEPRLLPYFDFEASFLLQCELEADGINIFTESPWTQIKQIDQQKWLQVGNQVLQVDEVIFAQNYQPNLSNLNLESWGVKFNQFGFPLVNKKLQTTNQNIYVCGDILGGFSQTNISEYEADIAVKNALFFPLFSVNYNCLPVTVFTNPNLTQVGLTEHKAKQFYGDNVQVVGEYFKHLPHHQNSGFCKLICLNDGTILGCVMVSNLASEIIGAIALAIDKKIKLAELANFYYPSCTNNEIITKVAISGKIKLLKSNKILINLLKTWFNWRKK
jgi:pyruvate/2-oxoglutarate dehydrogenase complex dihydrolipoamide dehydrogenase (E3) component